jgi:hypothetical protein
MTSPLAQTNELAARMGGAALDLTRAVAILNAGSTRIRIFTGRMWVDPVEESFSEVQLAAVREVCLSYAERVYRNPDGATQQQSGPYAKSVASWAAGGPELSAAEKAELRTIVGSTVGMGTIATTRGPVEMPNRRPLYDSAEDLPIQMS